MPRTRIGIAVTFAVLLTAPAAGAHRPATRSQRSAIVAAVVGQGELSRQQAGCQTVTVSTVNPSYAVLSWPARLSRACAAVAANGRILEHHNGSGWQLVAVGSTLPCPIGGVPGRVARDLGLCA